MDFKDILKTLRKNKGLTQIELAKLTGLTRSAIGMYELGKREPSFEVLETLADFFNVDMNTLLGRKEFTDEISEPAEKDEREIEKDLQDMLHSVSTASFNSSSEIEDIEAFKAAVKVAMIQAKRIAKKKYTPKKEDD